MDYAAEQEMEIEALQAILFDEISELEGPSPSGWDSSLKCWRVIIKPTLEGEEDSAEEYAKRMELVFAHTPNYPDEAPLVKPRSLSGLSDAELEELKGILQQLVEENLGMSMMYNLVTAAQEWLREKVGSVEDEVLSPEEARKRAEEEEEKRIAEIRSHGVPVTPETFHEWLLKFKEELAREKSKLGEDIETDKKNRLTGKAWFMQQEKAGKQFEGDDIDVDDVNDADGKSEDEEDAFVDEEDDIDYDDDDDDGMLDDYLAGGTK